MVLIASLNKLQMSSRQNYVNNDAHEAQHPSAACRCSLLLQFIFKPQGGDVVKEIPPSNKQEVVFACLFFPLF